jgi:methanogenic corrinoid protein MtbC1
VAIVELAVETRQLAELVTSGRREQALAFVRAVMRTGVDRSLLVEQLLVAVERHVGDMWEAGLVDVPSSHAATAIVEDALDVVVSSGHRSRTRGAVLVACPIGDWHSLPGRFVGELLRLDGWDADFAGASTPPDALVARAQRIGARVAALSCSMPTTMQPVADAIAALHDAGIAVVVGGGALGSDGRRATAVGADAWCATFADASRVLDECSIHAPAAGSSVPSPVVSDIPDDVARANIVDSALRILHRTMPQDLQTLVAAYLDTNDLARILDLVAVAFLTGDVSVVHDEVARLRRFTAVRSIPPAAVDAGVIALADASPPGPVRTLLLEAATAASPPAGDAASPEFVRASRA